jgi:hypothetical protein
VLQLDLRPEDRDLLVDIVEEYLGDLRAEIGDTDNFDYRSKLKAEEKELREILDTLTHAQENSQMQSPPAIEE